VIVESTNGKYYAFDLTNDIEHDQVMDIIHCQDDFTIVGWKVCISRPKWAHNADELMNGTNLTDDTNNGGGKISPGFSGFARET